MLQRTVKKPIEIKGIGLHLGKETTLTIRPARPDRGIVFVRADLDGSPEIPALSKYVVSTQLSTTLGKGDVSLCTVEHVMAALAGMGVDNALIEVDGPEVPILDGSSAVFCDAIRKVGLETQLKVRPVLRLKRKVEVKVDGKWAVAEPSDSLKIHASIDWDHPIIGYQECYYQEGEGSFEEIAGARTFGFLKEVDALRRMGLAQGGSLENCIVLDDGKVLNPDGLRYPDEFVRHKVLDALGDFKLAGLPIQASIRLHRAGHDVHARLVAAILADKKNYEIVTERQPREEPALGPYLVAAMNK